MGGFIAALLAHKNQERLAKEQELQNMEHAAMSATMAGQAHPSTGYAAYQSTLKRLGPKYAEMLAPLTQHVEQIWGPNQPQQPPLRDVGLPPAPQITGTGSPGEPAPGIIGAEIPPPPAPPATGVPPPPAPGGDILSEISQPVSARDWMSPRGQAIRAIQGGLPGMQLSMAMDPVLAARAKARATEAGINWDALSDVQKAQYMKEQTIPFEPFHALGEGQVGVQGGQVVASGPPKPIIATEGSQVLLPPPPGGGTSSTAGAGATGFTPIASVPPKLNEKEGSLLRAAQTVANNHKLPFDPNKNPRQPLMQLPDQYVREAQMLADPMLQIRADNLNELRAQRHLRSQELAMRVQDFNLSHSPEFIQSFVGQMRQDPQIYYDNSLTQIRPLLTKAWSESTGLPIPAKLDANMKTQLDNAQITTEHINNVKTLLKDPVIQKRIGPIMGRIGNLEQSVGESALPAEEAKKVQDFRSSLNYLYMRELRSLLGGRPPEKLALLFKDSSATAKQGMPMLSGALNAAERTNRSVMTAAEKRQFGGKTLSQARGGLTPPPGGNAARPRAQDAQGNVVEWDGKAWAPVAR